ncbi:MAG: hypothetical protein JWO36_3068 [Myxococcales bacterium]|nr:hypothetical protein [Myxococcales bacterium]
MARWFAFIPIATLLVWGGAEASPVIRCDDSSTADLSIDGLLDDWKANQVLARAGGNGGVAELRCSWDGTALGLALDIKDDRVVRVRGKGDEDHVTVSLAAGGKPVTVVAYPGNAIAKSKLSAPRRVLVADSLQPKGFSIELRVPAAALPGFSASTPSFELHVVFHDSDQATGGEAIDVTIDGAIELGDRKDLLDDFLKTVKLRRSDIKLDTLAELDPDRKGKERIVAGGTVIGVLTDQFAFVTLPAQKPSDVRSIALLPLGNRGQQVVSAIVRQTGNGGARDLLMLWTVWSGQLQPLGQIEARKELGGNVLEVEWKIVKGKAGPELVVTPKPAIGLSAETWNEAPADDADPILLPWDTTKGGIGYSLRGAELQRRDLPAPKKKR